MSFFFSSGFSIFRRKKKHLSNRLSFSLPPIFLPRPASVAAAAACLAFHALHSSSPSTLLASSSVLSPLEEKARRLSCVAASRALSVDSRSRGRRAASDPLAWSLMVPSGERVMTDMRARSEVNSRELRSWWTTSWPWTWGKEEEVFFFIFFHFFFLKKTKEKERNKSRERKKESEFFFLCSTLFFSSSHVSFLRTSYRRAAGLKEIESEKSTKRQTSAEKTALRSR